jgi:hypothetical protein
MNTHLIARDLAQKGLHSLREHLAEFASAINGQSAQDLSKLGRERPNFAVVLADRPAARPFCRHIDGDSQKQDRAL